MSATLSVLFQLGHMSIKVLMLSKIMKEDHVWWCMPVIPTTWEAEVGGSQYLSSPDKSTRPYLENKIKAKVMVGLA
jgi:hypothetical protein